MVKVTSRISPGRVLAFFRPDSTALGLAGALLAAATAASLIKPWPLALIVDCVLADNPFPDWMPGKIADWPNGTLILFLSGMVLVLHLLQGGFAAAQNFVTIRIGLRGLNRVRSRLFIQLQRLSLGFHQKSRIGDLIYRASWDTYAFQTFFQQGLCQLTGSALSVALMIVVMWRIHPGLTAAAAVIIPVLIWVMAFFGTRMKQRSLEAHAADSRVMSVIQQTLQNLPLIQITNREGDQSRYFGERTLDSLGKRERQHKLEVVYQAIVTALFGLATAIVTWLGARAVLEAGNAGQPELTLGELLVFLAYLAQLYQPLSQLSQVGATLSDAGAGTRRVLDILDTPPEIAENADPVHVVPVSPTRTDRAEAAEGSANQPRHLVSGAIEFRNVSFGYDAKRPVLRDVSFQVAAGESVILAGASGSGKTTLLQLIPRFFDPTSGSIHLDGLDARDASLTGLRRCIALVFQEPLIMADTVENNIRFGNPDASREEVEAAAEAAFASPFIRTLPRGFDTVLGEDGARLSVGERQRLNLARAFLQAAPILLLDEPTSALDRESETLVVEGLNRLKKGRTTLLVTHRPEAFESVKRRLTLHDGRVG